MKKSDWISIRCSIEMALLAIALLLLVGCAYNPYQQPHFDWTGVPSLVPMDERKPADVGKMCLGGVA